MKTFINILIRRILYRVPITLLILIILAIWIGLLYLKNLPIENILFDY